MVGGSLIDEAEAFWRVQFPAMLHRKYGLVEVASNDHGFAAQSDWSLRVSVPLLMRSLGARFGFSFAFDTPHTVQKRSSWHVSTDGGRTMPLTLSVLVHSLSSVALCSVDPGVFMAPRIKVSNFSNWFRSRSLLCRAQQHWSSFSYGNALHYFSGAAQTLQDAIAAAPANTHMAGDYLYCLAQVYALARGSRDSELETKTLAIVRLLAPTHCANVKVKCERRVFCGFVC